jgi:hypothetical protein
LTDLGDAQSVDITLKLANGTGQPDP